MNNTTKPHKSSDMELIKRTESLTEYFYRYIVPKFPKSQRATIGMQMEKLILDILYLAIEIVSYNARNRRHELLLELDLKIKVVCRLVRIARINNRAITEQNRDALINKLTELDNITMGWALKLDGKDNKNQV
jgi:hypothetical protein